MTKSNASCQQTKSPEFFVPWLILASALHVLMQPNISRAMLNAADTMLAQLMLLQHSFLKGTAACRHLKELFQGTHSAPVRIDRTFLLIMFRHISRMSRHILTDKTSEK